MAGGDGTHGWLLGAVADLQLEELPPVATIPLGTGNNLPFSFGWVSEGLVDGCLPMFVVSRVCLTQLFLCLSCLKLFEDKINFQEVNVLHATWNPDC